MKIGILGAGNIGKTLVERLSSAGHDAKVANSRGPETISPDVLSCGGRAVTAEDAVVDVDVVITSTPFMSIPKMRPLLANLPDEVTMIDTSNYYPHREDKIDEINAGQAESVWIAKHIGRPIAKAWNTIITASFDTNSKPAGSPDRIALPVAADRARDLDVAMALVEQTGFDAVNAGPLEESWRMQPGAPSYCTDLNRDELVAALAATERSRLAKRRDQFFPRCHAHLPHRSLPTVAGSILDEATARHSGAKRVRQCGQCDIIAMEACCGAHYLGRQLIAQRHTTKLMPPEYLRPYVMAQKNDDRDAEATAEAATRPQGRLRPGRER